MKISHSIIVLTSIIFVTGSMITVGMDLQKTTNNISSNVIEAKHIHNLHKEAYLLNNKKYGEIMDSAAKKKYNVELQKDQLNKQKTTYKLKSLDQQNNTHSANKFLQSRKSDNRTSID